MRSVWNVTVAGGGVTFPIQGRHGTITIDWGDNNADTISSGTDVYKSHTYNQAGTYTITVTGQIDAWSCYSTVVGFSFKSFCGLTRTENASLIKIKSSYLIEIQSYGNITLGTKAFYGANQLVRLPAEGTPRFVNNDSSYAFYDATSFNHNIDFWDTSNITNMSYMFYNATSFNQLLNNWDTSNVTNMSYMFSNAISFNQPLNNWDTSNVTDMNHMFCIANGLYDASNFNQPLNNWDTSNVTDMSFMFNGATSFNQPLNSWNVSKVTNMEDMFGRATSFNQPLNSWDTSNVTRMYSLFWRATSFNQPLNSWNVSNVTNMQGMFSEATSFNQPLDSWNVSKVTNMAMMFWRATSFNQPLDNWNISNISNSRNIGDIFSQSGLNQDNYCQLFAGPYASYWQKYKSDLGKSYSCP
ncbi:MAG: BspA family leucine-rich repeat surface protein [Proteobacteria bacterium]|nr:BspA family leucine-rich repeat surface protein [Pseudomonadota bacterium]